MIRNVVVGRVRPDTDLAHVQEALDAIVALPVPGLVDVRVGLDAGLRPGAWSFAITSDFVDAEAYRAYDAEAEHNRIGGSCSTPSARRSRGSGSTSERAQPGNASSGGPTQSAPAGSRRPAVRDHGGFAVGHQGCGAPHPW